MSRHLALWIWLVLAVAACDSSQHYVGVGDVLVLDAHEVTIRHDRIEGLMDAATTRFLVSSDEVRGALTPGARVRFELRRRDDALELTRATALAAGNPGIHDHTPHHGGVVAMVGMIHLEAKASADGRVQVYLTDVWRRPLPLDDVHGTATLNLPEGKPVLPLVVGSDALEANGPRLARSTVNVAVALQRAGEPVEVSFLLPIDSPAGGAAGIPLEGCTASAPGSAGGHVPRCVLAFAKPVVALATAPDATTFLVAQVDLGVSAWRLPGEFLLGFAPPPPVAIALPEPPHPEAPNAVLVRPDGGEAVVALENRLILYSMASGQVVRVFEGPGGIIRAAAWAPDGMALLVSAFYNRAAALLDAGDGHVRSRFPVEREGAAVAFAPDGRTVAVGSENGPVTLFDVDTATPLRTLSGARGPVQGLAFIGEQLLAAGDDGILRTWEIASGGLRVERRLGPTLRVMAVNGDGSLAAVAGTDPRIELIALADGTTAATLTPPDAQVLALAWAGATLVSGDSAGRVALWPVEHVPQ
jgi:hypothetical protein